MIKVSYDENFRVTGLGYDNAYETTEPFILLDLTNEEFEQLLEKPFKTMAVDVGKKSVVTVEIEGEPEEVVTVEELKKENDDLKARLTKLESLLNI